MSAPTAFAAAPLAHRSPAEHLIVRVHELLYAIPLDGFDQVGNSTFQPQTEPAANLPSWRGIADWNGRAVAVLDLHRLIDPASARLPAPPSAASRLVLFSSAGFGCALLVDACIGSFALARYEGIHLGRTRLVTEPVAGYGEIFSWRDELVVRIRPADLIRPATLGRIRERLQEREARSGQPGVPPDRGPLLRSSGWPASRIPGRPAEPTGPSAFEGMLDGHGLSQAFQVIGLRGLTGELSVTSALQTARVWFQAGQPWRATLSGAAQGAAALQEISRWRKGRYQFTESAAVAGPGNIEGSPDITHWTQRLLQNPVPTSTPSP